MIEILKDALTDTIKIIPFLLLTYYLIEWLEHNLTDKLTNFVQKSSRLGPFFGSIAGLLPQCGFSSIASTLYVTRILTLGTLMSIYLTTSDEMLPILISKQAPLSLIVSILSIKFVGGMIVGFCIDLVVKNKKDKVVHLDALCIGENCNCDESIFKSALKHTLKISFFIFVVTILLNHALLYLDLEAILTAIPTGSVFISALIGLIPNCAASIALTELYLSNILSFGAMMAGLFTNAGVGLLILFRINKDMKENSKIVLLLFMSGLLLGLILQIFG